MTANGGPGPADVGDRGERIEILDLIRGFTLGGILFANMLWFSGFLEVSNADRQLMLSRGIDEVTLFLIRVFVHAKFYHVFAFLFGLGFALQLQRNTAVINRMFSRRLTLLFLFGVLHSLIWWGDIVRYYAVLGFSLLLFRHLGQRQILIWFGAFSVLPVLMGYAQAFWNLDFAPFKFVDIAPRDWLAHVQQASLWELFLLNLRQIGDHFLTNVGNGRIFKILAMFLLGLLVGRLGILAQPEQHAERIRRVLWPSFLIGLIGNLISVSLYYQKWGMSFQAVGLLRDGIALVSVPALSLFYVAMLLHLSLHARRYAALFGTLRLLIPAGRMALTNYILQSVIAISVFRPGLGGQYAQLGVFDGAVLVLVIFSAQIAFSHWWLARYRFGPLEWLWRSGTKQQWQVLRR